jgi:hypothetical protein
MVSGTLDGMALAADSPSSQAAPDEARVFTFAGFWRTAEARWVALGAALFGMLFSYPMLLRLAQPSEQNDWDFEGELHWVPYHVVTYFHQFPLWDPYKCGGLPMLGNPQSRFLTPLFILHLIFGPMIGMHLEVTFHLAIAWAGGYVFARLLGMRPLAAIVAATIFPAGGWFPLHIGEGHIVFLMVAYLPWVLVFMMLAEKRFAAFTVLGGCAIALSFLEGGAVLFIHEVPVIGLFALFEAWRHRNLRSIEFVVIASTLGAGFSAIKLIPALEVLHNHPRTPWGPAWVMWHDLPQIFFSRSQEKIALHNRFFIEFGTYTSPAFVMLMLAGIILMRTRVLPWIAIGWFLVLAIRGDNCLIPVFSWLRELPLLSDIRLSSRFLIPLSFCGAIVAGYGADELIGRFGSWGFWFSATLLVLGTIDSLLVGTPYLVHAYDRTPHQIAYSPTFRQFADGDVFDQTVVAQANMGFVHCYDYTEWKTRVVAYNEPHYLGEQYMAGPGTVSLAMWSPNRLSYQVDAPARSTVVINQNYEPGWSLAQGQGSVISANGLLAVSVPAGRQSITLRYRGTAFELGALISILSLLIAVALAWSGCRRQ